MRSRCLLTLVLVGVAFAANAREIVVVQGADGEAEYGEIFDRLADQWEAASETAEADFRKLTSRDEVEALFAESDEAATGERWLVLIGHGSYDGRVAKFNVEGPDFSDTELAEWAKDFPRPLVVLNFSASSGSFVRALSGPERVVVTATKSPGEMFYPRFGEYFSEVIGGRNPEADLDNDQQVSLLEAFVYSAGQVTEFYEKEGRLATEHSLLDDNGDQLGTRPDWFDGVRATRVAKDGAEPDGERAHQRVLLPNATESLMPEPLRERRDALELQVSKLRREKSEMAEDAYYQALEPLLREIAEIYQEADALVKPPSS